MELDDEICLCFHVTKRKVTNYIRIEQPRVPAQLADCYGAGTGCGWCRGMLKRLFEASRNNTPDEAELSSAEYARERARYIKTTGAKPPPGATPIDDESTQ